MKQYTTFVGLDVHKDSIAMALADGGSHSDARFYGTLPGDLDSLYKTVSKLQNKSKRHILRFVYEAGPCGYEIYRFLISKGVDCIVVAPSMIPRKSGDRIKNDRRDALTLARLHRAGELTAIYVPTIEDEAMRDLTRAREDMVNALRVSRQLLSSFLLRHGHNYSGKTRWSRAHMNWIADIKMGHYAQQITLQEYVDTIKEQADRVKRVTEQIRQLAAQWKFEPLVKAYQALRGVSLIVAVTTLAELGDLGRFKSPKQLMAYLGLVPSLHSSGPVTKRGSITKTGNGHARRVLTEAAHAYRYPARQSRVIAKRLEGVPKQVRAIAWKAQVRLCGRFRRLTARGKQRNKVVIAIARELCGFMWAIAQSMSVTDQA